MSAPKTTHADGYPGRHGQLLQVGSGPKSPAEKGSVVRAVRSRAFSIMASTHSVTIQHTICDVSMISYMHDNIDLVLCSVIYVSFHIVNLEYDN